MYNVRLEFSPEKRNMADVAIAGLSKASSDKKNLQKVESAVSLNKSLRSGHSVPNKSLDHDQIKALSIAETLVPSPDGRKFSFGVGRGKM